MEEETYSLWSNGYGAAVHLLDDQDTYPVAGYGCLLDKVYQMIRKSGARKILDAGFGTGILTQRLYEDGYEISGMDISEQMVEAGKVAMSRAKLVCADYSMGMPLAFLNSEFDLIVSTYAFHHLDRMEKIELLEDMLRQLKDGGMVIIGDLGFETLEDMKTIRNQNKDHWMYGDMYMVYSELKKDFPDATWTKISKCAGIICITK